MTKTLLHACCAPCSIAVIDELRQAHDLTVLFYNPNVYPAIEYVKRKAEVTRLCREWGVPMIDADYEPEQWERACAESPRADEGGPRCLRCYRLRLARAADEAAGGGFALWATSLSSGRQKVTAIVNKVALTEAARVGVAYLDTDWKKGGRQERARAMVAERGIYRQDYCGCRFSLAAKQAREAGGRQAAG
jgi:predicted adenine nucleotide alpha hydrolase (AANH) superfamily ATPase